MNGSTAIATENATAEIIAMVDRMPIALSAPAKRGRFAVEDTRKAVQEARRLGTAVFGVTIDAATQSYFPTLFGRSGYAIVGNIKRLPAALPALYRQLTQ